MASPPTDPVLRRLLRSPRLALHVRDLERVLEAERARRARFYDEVTEGQKAEFINGEPIVHSPAKLEHTEVVKRLLTLLHAHVQLHDLGWVGAEKVLVSLTRNDYEPDVCFFGRDKAAAFQKGQMRFPAPDFAAEVLSPSTERVDRTLKREDYAAHGVAEYWLLDPDAETVEQHVLDGGDDGSAEESAEGGGRYTLRLKSGSGEVASTAVEGFAVPVRALFDDAANLEALRRLLGTA